jgi:hypothetical protein
MVARYFTLLLAAIFMGRAESFAQLAGTYTVGPSISDNFACITCDGGLFDSLNTRGRSGAVNVLISGDLSGETGQHALAHDTTGFPLNISPSAAALRTITYAGSGGILIDFDGADRVTIDGRFNGSGRFLKFVSAETAQPVIQINNDAKQIIVRNCLIESNNASKFSYSAGAIISRSFGTTGNDSLQITGNRFSVKDAIGTLREGLHITAPAQSGQSLMGLKIEGNEFDAPNGIAVNIEGEAGSIPQISIRGNSFFASRPIRGGNDGELTGFISINSGGGHQILGNFFGGSGPKCTGNKADIDLAASSSLLYFVWLGPGCTGSGTNIIDSNVTDLISIKGSNASGTSISLFEIHPNVSDSVYIGKDFGNTFGSATGSASTLANARLFITERFNSTQNTFRVIRSLSSGFVSVYKNRIGGLLIEHNSASGIEVSLVSLSGAASMYFSQNSAGGTPVDNIVKRCDGNFSVFDIASRGTIENNAVSGIKAINFFGGTFRAYSVFTTGGAYIISNNTLGSSANASTAPAIEVSHIKSVPETFYGIQIFGQGATSVRITDQQIGGIFSNTDSVIHPRAVKLISVSAEVSNELIIERNTLGMNNAISILQHTDAALKAIEVLQPNCPKTRVSENQIGAMRTGGKFGSYFSGIHLQGKAGQNNAFVVENNTLGDTTLNALLSSSLLINTKNTGAASGSDLIAIEEPNHYSAIRNNYMGGVYLLNTNAGATSPFFAIRAGGSRDSLIITDNIIGSRSTGNNFLVEAQTGRTFLVFAAIADGSIRNEINRNNISNFTFRATFNHEVVALRSAFGATALGTQIQDNLIYNFKVGNGGSLSAFSGIRCENREALIQRNRIRNIEVNSTYNLDQFSGIWLTSAGGNNRISDNTVSDIQLSAIISTESTFTGIAAEGTGATIELSANRVHEVSINAIGDGSIFKGILLSDASNIEVFNNLVHYHHKTDNRVSAIGIYDFSRSGTNTLIHNTVALFGTLPKNMSKYTAAYYKTNGANRTLKNNVFCNALRDGQGNYTVFAATNQGSFFANYNLHYTEDHADSMMFYNDAVHMKSWRDEGFGKNSMHPPRGQYLIDSTDGRQLSHILNNKGELGTGIISDINGQSRPLEAGPDFGAYELSSAGLKDGLTGNGAEHINPKGISVYPNPSARGQKVYFSETATGEIRDIQGRVIDKIQGGHSWQADVKSGVYFLVTSEGASIKITIK